MHSLEVCFFNYVYYLRQRNIYFKAHCSRDDVRVEIFFQRRNSFSCNFYVNAFMSMNLMNEHILK